MTDYAQRLAAHPMWRWEPGMVAQFGLVAGVGGVDGAVILIALPEIGITRAALSEAVPDIHNPATQGHLMASIWKRNHKAHTYCNAGWWWVTFTRADGATPGEAIAKAWLETWGAS